MMTRYFPTFSKFLSNRRAGVPAIWKRRGATWYTNPWWPSDSLHSMQCSLLRVLCVAHSERLELIPLLTCLRDDHRGRYHRILARLVQRLAQGVPLVAALEQTPDALSDSALLALRFGSQSGTVNATYEQLLAQRPGESPSVSPKPRYSLAYWLTLAVILVVMLAFLLTVVAPTFKMISSEFGLQLPRAFQMLCDVFDAMMAMAGLWIVAVLACVWLILSGTSRRFFRRAVAGRLLAPVAQLRIVELFPLLANAIEAGRPLPGALSTLARYHFDRNVRQKLLYSRNEVEQGVDVWQSLSDAKLLTPQESHALASAPSNGLRAWTLRRLALVKQSRHHRRIAVVMAFLEPAVVLCFAAIVLWICYAFISFIAGITSAMT